MDGYNNSSRRPGLGFFLLGVCLRNFRFIEHDLRGNAKILRNRLGITSERS